MALTAKQEQFCQNVFKGMTYKDAYKAAYNSKGTDQNASNEASKLMLREDIQARLNALNKPVTDALQQTALTEREKKRNILWSFINDTNKSDNDRLKALDLLNKMDSEYTNVNHNINDNKLDLSGIDIQALQELSKQT